MGKRKKKAEPEEAEPWVPLPVEELLMPVPDWPDFGPPAPAAEDLHIGREKSSGKQGSSRKKVKTGSDGKDGKVGQGESEQTVMEGSSLKVEKKKAKKGAVKPEVEASLDEFRKEGIMIGMGKKRLRQKEGGLEQHAPGSTSVEGLQGSKASAPDASPVAQESKNEATKGAAAVRGEAGEEGRRNGHKSERKKAAAKSGGEKRSQAVMDSMGPETDGENQATTKDAFEKMGGKVLKVQLEPEARFGGGAAEEALGGCKVEGRTGKRKGLQQKLADGYEMSKNEKAPAEPQALDKKKRKRRKKELEGGGNKQAEEAVRSDQGVPVKKSVLSKRPTNAGRHISAAETEEAEAGRAQIQQPQSKLLLKMRAKLQGGQFRMLNEKLYTCSGEVAFKNFSQNPALFTVYHSGYREQLSHWPEQPLEVIVKWLRSKSPKLRVADFGCGDALLAESVPNKVHSLDLVAEKPGVIACNMAHTPLASGSVDVAVFCLSLMGTDYPTFLSEAHRVLSPRMVCCLCRGWLVIAEVKSRFDAGNGGADPDEFVAALEGLGFQLQSQDQSNKMFLLWTLRKGETTRDVGELNWPTLKACIYKRR